MKVQFMRAVWVPCLIWAMACTGCGETEEIVDTKAAAMHNPYAWIGEAHNEGLNAVLNCLESNRTGINDETDLLGVTDRGIRQYFREKYGMVPDDAALRSGYDFARSKSRSDRLGKNSPGFSLMDSLLQSGVFTDGEQKYLMRLRHLRYGKLTPEAYDDSIDAISRDAYNDLGEKGSEKILIQTSVARSSYHYWTTNAPRWFSFISGLRDQGMGKLSEALGDSVFDGYVADVVETDYVAAGAAIIPCMFATIGWSWCVMGAAVGASAVYGLWHYPYYPW